MHLDVLAGEQVCVDIIILMYCLHRELEIPAEASSLADSKDFELKMYGIGASAEETRPPRKVKVAVVQNAIVKPTTDPIEEQVCM